MTVVIEVTKAAVFKKSPEGMNMFQRVEVSLIAAFQAETTAPQTDGPISPTPHAIWFPQATKILDWWHVVERLAEVVRPTYGEEAAGQSWLDRRRDNLSEGRPELAIRALQRLRRCKQLSSEAAEAIRLALGYLNVYQDQMDYHAYRERGCDIGSGRVEAACKRVVGARLKACGCRWNQQNAEALAVLRGEALSGRLQLFWEYRDNKMRAAAARRGPRKARNRAG